MPLVHPGGYPEGIPAFVYLQFLRLGYPEGIPTIVYLQFIRMGYPKGIPIIVYHQFDGLNVHSGNGSFYALYHRWAAELLQRAVSHLLRIFFKKIHRWILFSSKLIFCYQYNSKQSTFKRYTLRHKIFSIFQDFTIISTRHNKTSQNKKIGWIETLDSHRTWNCFYIFCYFGAERAAKAS